jgi:hypothetical protein
MKTIKKTINIGDEFLLGGVEDFFNDLIEEGCTVTEALNIISTDAVLRFERDRLYPSYVTVRSTEMDGGVFELEMEKLPLKYIRKDLTF